MGGLKEDIPAVLEKSLGKIQITKKTFFYRLRAEMVWHSWDKPRVPQATSKKRGTEKALL